MQENRGREMQWRRMYAHVYTMKPGEINAMIWVNYFSCLLAIIKKYLSKLNTIVLTGLSQSPFLVICHF